MILTRLSDLAAHENRLREIYHESFPPHEQIDFSTLLASITANTRWFYAALDHDQMLGFTILVPHVAADIHLLEYLAVARDARNGGIGGKLLDQLIETIRADQNIAGIILEVESDDEGDADEQTLRKRRIGFYVRHGACLIECAPRYRVPANQNATMAMKLLYVPFDARAENLRGEKLRECVIGIFEKSYGHSQDSKLTQENLAQLVC